MSAEIDNARKAAAKKTASRDPSQNGGERLLSRPEILDRAGVTYPTIWKWMREGTFPRSRALGSKVAWLESEIEEWIRALPTRTLKGDSDKAA
jgi:prophage regulatory protein